MKSKLLLFALCCGLAHAQGSLTPPGAPAPTMKTLDQVEPRRPLVAGTPGVTIVSPAGQIIITQPGSYYLTRTLTVNGSDGIIIDSDQVTLDLMGYAIRNSSASGVWYGISINVVNDISISNGVIAGGTTFSEGVFTPSTGFNRGINSSTQASNVRISHLSISGMQGDGIRVSDSSIVKDCAVFICGGDGIKAGSVSDCSVRTTGGAGIDAIVLVSNCSVLNAGLSGISAYHVTDSVAQTRGDTGIIANIVESCTGNAEFTSPGNGILARLVSNSRGWSSGSGNGIGADVVTNSYGFAGTNALHGISAVIVSNSIGERETNIPARVGISAQRANFCMAINGESILLKYNMP